MNVGPSPWTFRTSPTIVFGRGAIQELPDQLRRTGAGKAFVVTDPGIVEAGILARVETILQDAGIKYQTWTHVPPEPPTHSVDACAAAMQEAAPDVVIGLGGGSAMDSSQIAACIVTNGGKTEDWLGVETLRKPGIPTISVPTTAGTASELTGNAVVVLPDHSNKLAVVSPFIYPRVAVIDPALTDSLPPNVTAATGMDAFCHASETYLSLGATTHTRMFATESMRRIVEYLPRVVKNSHDANARDQMSFACTLAGYSLANAGTIIVHGLAHVIGARARIPHGVANTLCLLPVMRLCAESIPERMAGMAEPLGAANGNADASTQAQAVVDRMVALVDQVGLPVQLSKVGVAREWFPDVARSTASNTRLFNQSPVKPSESEMVQLLESVY